MDESNTRDINGPGIYQIKNKKNGKRYVGSSVIIRQRWMEHRSMLRRGRHHSKYMQRSWHKYGEDSFSFEVLEAVDRPEDLLAVEQRYLDRLNPEYNSCRVAGNTLGMAHSEETRRKISKRLTGIKHAPRSAEYRAKISSAHKGRMPSPEHMAALQDGRRNQTYSDERRRAVSESLVMQYKDGRRSRTKTEAHKQSIGKAFSKLTDDQVREIRRKKADGATCSQLAAEYDSNRGTISLIANRKRYRWVV